ncbi:MAG: AI-2E family transporter [Gemmobacter sp.]|uniref:AI-2E family transporter n=1 Tax=Gemmobacter sp. TaxID=1898957 RepID=UPI001A63DAF3|nr:AI-2E family transporter [Gemmobacter sp.]MBL8562424.1 AI-2E family transporter [Gemmobacter sp.]
MPNSQTRPPVLAAEPDDSPQARRITLPRLATIVGVAAVLHLGQEVFLPLAIAMLLTFALSPAVSAFRKRGAPLTASVLVVAFLAFSAIAAFSLVVAGQLSGLARDLPSFQQNILTKLEGLQEQGGENGLVARLTDMASAINDEIATALPAEGNGATATPAPSGPMQVEVVERQSPFDMLINLVGPIISPIATAGLVVVVVIFMLLEREELRDRFIRLIGSNDLHRSTQVLEDAGGRVANYLLIQLLVNVIYAVPIGLGLWLIGVPNALLWGMLTLVLRFVPYIGSVLSAAFPLFLAFAVSPDWNALLWTAALFLVVELATSNVIEPWLYGSRTGVSPLAIIVSAIFWTWIWGPLGLVLSTPLTVCLVVLGRHIPQFELFDILFGDEPVLAPHARLYQRWLAGDAIESTFRAEEALEEEWLSDYYAQTALPALMLAQADWSRGVLTTPQEERLAGTAMAMVADLQAVVEEERAEDPPRAAPRRILCIGGRSGLDDVAAAMLAQVLASEGAETRSLTARDLAPARMAALELGATDIVVLNFLDPSPARASLLHVRRLKRAVPGLRVGVVIWDMPEALLAGGLPVERVSPVKPAEALEIGADFAVTGLDPAVAEALSEAEALPLPELTARKKPARSRARRTAAAPV